jgi:hypothetical protein
MATSAVVVVVVGKISLVTHVTLFSFFLLAFLFLHFRIGKFDKTCKKRISVTGV